MTRIARRIAAAEVREARDAGLGRALPDNAIPEALASARWEPYYVPLDQV